MNPTPPIISGSPLWQLVFISFAAVLVLFEIVRGWRSGLMRQIARIAAVIVAYAAAIFGGKLLVPLARPFVKLPDVAIAAIAGAILAFICYAVISILGRVLFKRTGQHNSMMVRWFYGATGAALGLVFGAFLVWLIVVGVRSLGAIAGAKAQANAAGDSAHETIGTNRSTRTVDADETAPMLETLARLKSSIELGALGDVVKKTDVIPVTTYETLGKIGEVVSNPQSAERFLSCPGARELSEHPKIIALRNDPEITDMIARGKFIDLLHDPRIIDAANDRDLSERVTKFDLQRALDYAAQKDSR